MRIGNKEFDLKNKSYIMGILNVTPDSFSDGGKFNNIEAALEQAKIMIGEGASILDIGGESTRPGHEEVSVEEEINRVVPVIEALTQYTEIPISIDTSKAAVAEAALKAGAHMINDVWGFKRDSQMANVAAKYNVPVCLMHNRNNKDYKDLIPDMIEDLKESVHLATSAGLSHELIILDPGIGFAKSLEDNLKVMANLDSFTKLGYPVLLGTSRKSMIGLTLDVDVNNRLEGTLATTTMGVMAGCGLIRVHDVLQNKRNLDMTEAIQRLK